MVLEFMGQPSDISPRLSRFFLTHLLAQLCELSDIGQQASRAPLTVVGARSIALLLLQFVVATFPQSTISILFSTIDLALSKHWFPMLRS